MITPSELKTALAESLGERLGTYKFSNGEITPAIRIEDGNDPYPEEPNRSGLEVVVVPQVEVAVKDLMGGYQETYTTTIVLKEWDIKKSVMTARPAVLSALHQFSSLGIGQVRRIQRQRGLNEVESVIIPVSEQVWTAETYD